MGMNLRLSTSSLSILAILVLTGCAARGPSLEQMDADQLFQQGMERLRERKWTDAVTAFERFTLAHAGHPRVAEARFRLAEAYMGRRDYVTAAVEFNRLASDFPAGAWADDARFGVCTAYYELAPEPPLDQEYTRTAIDHCRSLVSYYPESEFVPQAQERITELTARLAEKEYTTAEYYFRRRAFDSALIYYQTVADEYRGTAWAPRALLRMHESYERLGYEQEARETRERLLRDYPDSVEARQLSGAAAPAGS